MNKLFILLFTLVLLFASGCNSNTNVMSAVTSDITSYNAISEKFCIKNDQGEIVITSEDVFSVDRFSDEFTEYGVIIKFNEQGAEKFSEMTGNNVGKTIFIYVGNTIIMAPTVEAKNEGGSTILNCADKSAEDKLFNQLTGAI